MSSQRKPGGLTFRTPRLVGIVLSLVILLAVAVVVAVLLQNDDEDQPAAGEIVAIGAWVRVVPAAAAGDGATAGVGAMTPAATEMPAEGEAAPAAETPAEGEMTPSTTESMGEGGGMAMGSGGMTAGAFLTLRNETAADARLVGVSVPASVARAAELHETTVDENQVMRMRPVEGMDIPRGQEVQLAPGGLHIMLLDVQPAVAVGTTVELTLTFADGTTLVIPADVREAS